MQAELIGNLHKEKLPPDPWWIEKGILPKRGVLLLGGEAKIGKTFCMMELARDLTKADRALWGVPGLRIPAPLTVLYLEQEIGRFAFMKRIHERYATEKPPDNFWVATRTAEMVIDTPQGKEIVAGLIEQTQANVVCIDPISQAIVGDENSNNDIKHLFKYLKQLTEKFDHLQLSFVLAHHYSKPPKSTRYDDDILSELSPYNFRGAAKWFDAPDTLITMRFNKPRDKEWKRLETGWMVRQDSSPEKPIILAVKEPGRVEKVD